MRRFMIVAVVALAALTATNVWAATSTSRVAYPASCKKVRCVNNHLNNLDARLHRQHTQILALRQDVQAAANQLSCYYAGVAVREYGTDQSDYPANQPAFLDLTRGVDSAQFRLVASYC